MKIKCILRSAVLFAICSLISVPFSFAVLGLFEEYPLFINPIAAFVIEVITELIIGLAVAVLLFRNADFSDKELFLSTVLICAASLVANMIFAILSSYPNAGVLLMPFGGECMVYGKLFFGTNGERINRFYMIMILCVNVIFSAVPFTVNRFCGTKKHS